MSEEATTQENSGEGLLADAAIQPEETPTEEAVIDHREPTEAPSIDNLVVSEDEETVEYERPEWFPEKFWSEDDGPNIEALANSFKQMEAKFSKSNHKAPEEYDTKVFSEANIGEDDELANAYTEWAKENGISQSAFNDLATKFISMAGQEQEMAEISYKEEYEKLGPNADMTIKSMTDWAQGLVRKGVWSEDDFEEFKIMGGTAQGIRALQKVRSYYGDQPVPVDVGPVEGMPSKEELASMVSKPEYLNDPAYRQKVEKMFDQVYGTEEYRTV